EIGAEGAHHLYQLWVVHIDLVGAGQPAARLEQRLVAFLLLGGHLVVGDLGIASKGRGLGHLLSPPLEVSAASIAAGAAPREALITPGCDAASQLMILRTIRNGPMLRSVTNAEGRPC